MRTVCEKQVSAGVFLAEDELAYNHFGDGVAITSLVYIFISLCVKLVVFDTSVLRLSIRVVFRFFVPCRDDGAIPEHPHRPASLSNLVLRRGHCPHPRCSATRPPWSIWVFGQL